MAGGSSFIRNVETFREKTQYVLDAESYLGLSDIKFDIIELNKEELQRKVDQFCDFLMIIDYRLRVKLINKAYLRFLGKEKEEVEDLACFDVLYGPGDKCDGCPWLAPLLEKRCVTVEREFSDKILEFHMIPLFSNSGESVGIWLLGRLIKKEQFEKLASGCVQN